MHASISFSLVPLRIIRTLGVEVLWICYLECLWNYVWNYAIIYCWTSVSLIKLIISKFLIFLTQKWTPTDIFEWHSGCFWETHINMALTSNPTCFFHDESISSCCAPWLRRGERFWAIHVHGVVMIKSFSKCQSSTRSKLLKISRNYIEGDSKYSKILSHRKQKISPVCGSNNIISEVAMER